MEIQEVYKNIGKIIREERNKAGITLEELVEKIDRDWSYLSQIERGKSVPSIETLVRISNALNISLSNLFKSKRTPGRYDLDPYIKKIAFILRDKDEEYKKIVTNIIINSIKKKSIR